MKCDLAKEVCAEIGKVIHCDKTNTYPYSEKTPRYHRVIRRDRDKIDNVIIR